MTKLTAMIVLSLGVLLAAQSGSVSDEALDALIRADQFDAVVAAVGHRADWTNRVVSVFEEQGDLLTIAAMHGSSRVVAGLLAANANVDGEPAIRDGRNVWGFTPLYLAAREGRVEVVGQLIRARANTTRPDRAGFQPLHAAAAFGRLEIVKALLDAGVPVDSRAARGDTALKLAVMRGKDETAMYLLTRHANVNVSDERGDTPLHEAARNGAARLTRALLDAGAVCVPNHYGRTALDDATDWSPNLLAVFNGR